MDTSTTPVERFIAALGGVTSAAKILNIRSYQTVQQWRINGVPAEYCPAIDRATSGAVTCEELRPDVDWGYLRATPAPIEKILTTTRAQLGMGEPEGN